MAASDKAQLLWAFFDPQKKVGDERTYHFGDPDLVTKINVAIAIGRPLLLTGNAGVGKSSIARGVSQSMADGDWALFQKTVTSHTDANDLKAEFDAIGRLNDAHLGHLRNQAASGDRSGHSDKEKFVTPGVLWKAYDPDGARRFLAQTGRIDAALEEAQRAEGCVVLIDEIDKGDLDFANDLLDVFGAGSFEVSVIGKTVTRNRKRSDMLVVITSNGERELSPAFVRRCIPHQVKAPAMSHAVQIGRAHLRWKNVDLPVLKDERLNQLAGYVKVSGGDPAFEVAQYVDLLDAVAEYKPREATWSKFAESLEAFAAQRRSAAQLSVSG